MGLFIVQWAVLIIGAAIHIALDRKRRGGGRARTFELLALWFTVVGGFWVAFGGIFHIGPTSGQVADQIGYTQSMFQWEVGWADIAVGVVSMAVVAHRNRGTWWEAVLLVTLVYFWGDGIGHIMQWVSHGNTSPDNLGAIPSDFLQPVLALAFLAAFRRSSVTTEADPIADTSARKVRS